MAVMAIRHTGIVVADMSRSLRFYRDLLGMEVSVDFEDSSPYVQAVTDVSGARIRMVKLNARAGGSIELLQYLSHPQELPAPRASCDVGCNHVALQVDDIDALYEKLSGEGIRFHTPPTASPDGFAKTTYCRDPEGVIVELVELLEDDGGS